MKIPYRGNGKVFYMENEYNCDLYFSEEQGGILIKINLPFPQTDCKLELPREIKWIFGQLANGFRFTLNNLIRTGRKDIILERKTEYTYEADYIFCGIGGKEEQVPSFINAYYTLSDIIEWGGITGYKIEEDHELAMKHPDKIVLYEKNELNVSYEVTASFLPVVDDQLLKEKIELTQQGAIVICINNSNKEFSYFNLIFQKLRKLIEMATIRKINVEKVILYSEDVFDMYGDYKVNREIKVYGKNISHSQEEEIESSPFRSLSWIPLNELIAMNCVERYLGEYNIMEPILDLYQELLYTPITIRRIFLNTVQAIETYHSRFITNSFDKYKNMVKDLVKDLPSERKEKAEKFLLPNSKGRNITLESRLAYLLFLNQQFFDTGDIEKCDFPKVIAQTRNYYIHYDEEIKKRSRVLSIEELKIYNSVLLSILDYYIFKELGYKKPVEEQKEKLYQRWGSVSVQLDILKQSREQI